VTTSCVLIGDRHHALNEGVRGLLEAAFECVLMVGDEASLLEGTARLMPLVVIADIAMAQGDLDNFIARLISRSPDSKIVLLTSHDEPSVAVAAARAGAHGIVLKRSMGAELLSAVDEVLAGRYYVSPDMRR